MVGFERYGLQEDGSRCFPYFGFLSTPECGKKVFCTLGVDVVRAEDNFKVMVVQTPSMLHYHCCYKSSWTVSV